MSDTPEAAAREVAELIAAKYRSGHPTDYGWNINMISAALLSFRRAALEEAIAVLSRESADEDPDDLYTSRTSRIAAIRALAGSTKEGE